MHPFLIKLKICKEKGHVWKIVDKDGIVCECCGGMGLRRDRMPYLNPLLPSQSEFYLKKYNNFETPELFFPAL